MPQNEQDTSPAIPLAPVGALLPGGTRPEESLPENNPTTGYRLNHFMLRIRDPKATLHFYIDLMGMRTVFTMNAGPMTIYYLGYPQTPEHRADPAKFSRDTCAQLPFTLGLLELFHIHGSEKSEEGYHSTGNTPPALGFGHLGFTVPDVPAAVKRLETAGVSVFKSLGEASKESIPINSWEVEKGIGAGEVHPFFKAGFENIAFVRDPDGYLVELVPQTMPNDGSKLHQ
ncbi:Glyoxalase/Bleomycin resistance protein/Dihydroxybiphenyl dioxygenase [Ilyonectria destructans]|nr:Glyoxalase/Bleomycin resistance protein/Dihydroxybiphenyl dioxygenase [Ilyonectria destructans]